MEITKEAVKKPTKLVLNNKADYDREVEKELTMLIFAECKKDTNNMSRIDALGNKLRPKAIKIVNERCRVKGTRAGHLNSAPDDVLTKVEQINNLIDQTESWGSVNKDGKKIEVKVGLIVKEVK